MRVDDIDAGHRGHLGARGVLQESVKPDAGHRGHIGVRGVMQGTGRGQGGKVRGVRNKTR